MGTPTVALHTRRDDVRLRRGLVVRSAESGTQRTGTTPASVVSP